MEDKQKGTTSRYPLFKNKKELRAFTKEQRLEARKVKVEQE